MELDNNSDILAIGICEIYSFHFYSVKDMLKKLLHQLFLHTHRHTHTQTPSSQLLKYLHCSLWISSLLPICFTFWLVRTLVQYKDNLWYCYGYREERNSSYFLSNYNNTVFLFTNNSKDTGKSKKNLSIFLLEKFKNIDSVVFSLLLRTNLSLNLHVRFQQCIWNIA